MIQQMNHRDGILVLIGALFTIGSCSAVIAADPFKLGVEEKQYLQQSSTYPDYPAPQAVAPLVPQQAMQAPYHAPMQAGIQKVALPTQFLGVWTVQGQRVKVEAQPQFQAGAQQAFAMETNTTWTISGNPSSGYSLGSSTGIQTSLVVDKVQNGTAFIRYQHPVNNTMAREAVVMAITPGGGQFTALERISIIKQGEPPRASVTYQLNGYRQR